jgi:polyhydroxybutyrate depolymerase
VRVLAGTVALVFAGVSVGFAGLSGAGVVRFGLGAGPPAAQAAELPEGVTQVRLRSGGLDRAYLLAAPPGPAPRPLLLLLHGVEGTPAGFAARTGLLELAAAGQAVVTVPAGWDPGDRRTAWNAGDCCWSAREQGRDDVAFLADVVADAARRAPVDTARVWVVGFSNGAMLGYRLACERPGLVAALVAVSGPRGVDCPAAGLSADPVPVLHLHGGADAAVPVGGLAWSQSLDTGLASVAASVAPFAAAAGCTGWATSARPGGIHRRYGVGCDPGAPVEVVLADRLGHRWTRDVAAHGLDETAYAVEWLQRLPIASAN